MTGARPRALVVDDDPLSLELASDLLRDAGWTVRQATAAEPALADAVAEPPDLALLDIGLPDHDGYWVMRAMRADPRLKRIAIIAVSAQAMPGSAEAAIAAGFDGYMVKPIEIRRFVADIAGIIAARTTD